MSAKIESLQPTLDQRALERGVHQLGLLYGMSGLEVVTKPGAGWSCAKTDRGLTITIDPQQSVEGNGVDNKAELAPAAVSPEVTSLFITAHELGHANDFLDPSWRLPAKPSPARAFFDCLTDDTVIDRRNRRVPLLDANADEVYSHQIPSDLTDFPKHVQLMYGIRISTVVDNPTMTMDESVAGTIASLAEYEKNEQVFNILEVLTDPRTSLTERRRIAEKFILPHFEALLEQDKQEDGGRGDPRAGKGEGEFESIYAQYEEAVHGHQRKGEGEGQEPQPAQGEASDQSAGSSSLGEQIAKAVKQAIEEQAKEAKAQSQARSDPRNEQSEALLAELAGTVAAEMQLSQGDAESYVRSLDKWTPTIKEVANVFLKLAAPANIIKSPRYNSSAHTEGLRLHPRTLAGVALQLATDQEQAIWQPVEQKARRQEVTFGGLDVHLIVDVSGSMAGAKAQCAADTAVCLIEGLQLARHKVAREVGQAHQPDVRTQIIAFGSGTEILSPLSYEPSGPQKGKTYTNLLEASSSATLVNGSLENVKQAAKNNPKRDAIVIVVSDGQFGDHDTAARTVAEMPKSVYVAHLVIGGGVQKFISNNHEAVGNPSLLPAKLHGVLTDYIRRNQL